MERADRVRTVPMRCLSCLFVFGQRSALTYCMTENTRTGIPAVVAVLIVLPLPHTAHERGRVHLHPKGRTVDDTHRNDYLWGAE